MLPKAETNRAEVSTDQYEADVIRDPGIDKQVKYVERRHATDSMCLLVDLRVVWTEC